MAAVQTWAKSLSMEDEHSTFMKLEDAAAVQHAKVGSILFMSGR
jgi:hypothetical protein